MICPACPCPEHVHGPVVTRGPSAGNLLVQDLIPDSPSEPWAAAAVPDHQPPHVPFVASDPSEMQDQVQLRPCSCQPHTCPCCACIQSWRDWCRHFVSRQLDRGPGSHRHTYTSCAGTEDDQGGRAAAVVCGDPSVASPNFLSGRAWNVAVQCAAHVGIALM